MSNIHQTEERKQKSHSKISSHRARHFLNLFDLNIHSLPSKKIHILDYPGGDYGFNQLKMSFEYLAREENLLNLEISSKLDDEPAATLVFLFLADPKDLAIKVTYLTTYTSSEHPTIWILVKEKCHPHMKEKIASIWEPLTNAQYFESRPMFRLANEKWIGTKFTVGRHGSQDMMGNKDIHMSLTLSTQAQQRRSSLF